jgi:RNA polymerase sigma-70 factor (ECF subfamily)
LASSGPPDGVDEKRAQELWQTLRRAMSRACPRELASMRDDLMQAALLRVLERERREAQPVRSASYLWRVAFSVAADELRRLRRRQSVHEEEPEPAHHQERDPALAQALRGCLDSLAEPRRLAVGLHLDGFTAEEAGRALRWDQKRVRNLIFRGMLDLRRCLTAKGLP